MNALKFMKYDLKRSRWTFIISFVFYAPFAYAMGIGNDAGANGIFAYMALMVVISMVSLVSNERRVDCGFDGMLPAKEIDRVAGRYLVGLVYVILELFIAIIVTMIFCYKSGNNPENLGIISTVFVGGTTLYLSIALAILYLAGRSLNQQARSLLVVVPNTVIWGGIYAFTCISAHTQPKVFNAASIYTKIIPVLLLIAGMTMYGLSLMISTHIVKTKDYR